MSSAAKVVAVIALIVLLNVALRFVDLPSVDLSLPDIDVPDWLQWVNRAKNVVVIGLLAAVVIGAVVKEMHRDRH
ncbi:hypothetical protein DVA67_015365 [Solirubrobacter sp. CPCC 204708]|uniref:Uncharacterized protein n=1 Tax=Solirubrobacter deserti TaxID=2282478 RepID=A0ABT4RKM7_9ACTN|nr:hypothetical protein [Solirubrobacter deserti]MBE2317360.1 hypothetical protein [Solirubrobacter deserti]MDA0139089.1 hypothetical protein [Solirubrobacter deserti]